MSHPGSGAVCVDLLTDAQWTPAASVRVVLLSLQSLLCSPTAADAASPANVEAAQLLNTDPPAFGRRARRDAAESLSFYEQLPNDATPATTPAPAPAHAGDSDSDPGFDLGIDAEDWPDVQDRAL